VHDDLLGRIASRLGVSSTPTLIPSDEADVYRLGSHVVKVERPDSHVVLHEQAAFPALRQMGFREMPEIVLTQDDVGETTRFNVMPFVPSRPLAEIWADDPGAVRETIAAVGDFLRRLSAVDWRDVPGVVPPDRQQASVHAWFERWLSVLPAVDAEPVLQTLEVEPAEFGSWQFMQVLTLGGPGFTAIDFGNIGAYWAAGDLSSSIATVQDVDGSLVRVLLDAYGPYDEDELARWDAVWRAFDVAATARLPA
jgi:hypothetical protein